MNTRRPVDRSHNGYIAKSLNIYQRSEPDILIGSFNVVDESIEVAINNKLAERNEKLKLLENPIHSLNFRDIWIECSTGFLLGNIRPISYFTQILQLIQIFILFIIATIIGNYISGMENLMITKKNT